MNYNFDAVIPRRHTACCKWDTPQEEGVVPMWVADMDFAVAPCIADAIRRRAEHPIFGYTDLPASYYDALIGWMQRRHKWTVAREDIIATTGVLPALAATLRAMTLPGEKVILQSPAYDHFFTAITNAGAVAAECPLRRQGDTYVMDYDRLDTLCADPKAAVFLLCNPHNPGGRVWTTDELRQMKQICQRHGVRIIADEIHGEIVMPGHVYTPFATLCDDWQDDIVCFNAPSKAFNLAGLKTANIVCHNPRLRRRIDRAINIHETCDLNPFGIVALEAAYNGADEWLDQCCAYIWDNYRELRAFFNECMPRVEVLRMEGTYLVWADITAIELTSDEAARELLDKGKVMVCSGTRYGQRTGQGYLRINIACPRATLREGLRRIARTLMPYMLDDDERGCPM